MVIFLRENKTSIFLHISPGTVVVYGITINVVVYGITINVVVYMESPLTLWSMESPLTSWSMESPLTLWFESRSGDVYSIQHYVLKFVSNLRKVGGFLHVLRVHPPIKPTDEVLDQHA